MFTFFSIVVILSPIVAVISAILWAISAVRKKTTKVKRILAVSAALFVISFIGCALTAPPVDKPKSDSEVPDVQNAAAEPAQEPVSAPSGDHEGIAPAESQEPTEGPQEAPQAEEPQSMSEPTLEQPPIEETDSVEQAKQDIETIAREIISQNYTQTDISSITVNENYGTDETGDYILLAYLTWNVKNSAEMTSKVLAMYSEDFAARVGENLLNVQEVAVFWTVPYYSETSTAIKYSYERREDGMYQTDKMIMISD